MADVTASDVDVMRRLTADKKVIPLTVTVRFRHSWRVRSALWMVRAVCRLAQWWASIPLRVRTKEE